jgi:hypothetical protein
VPRDKLTVIITFKSFAIWLGILLLAIANGAFREDFLTPELGQFTGLILSGILLSICIIFMAYFTLPWIGRTPARNYVLIGILWLCFTLLFEFSFGLAQGRTWLQLSEAYMFRDGNIWSIVLLVTSVAPYLAAKGRGWV